MNKPKIYPLVLVGLLGASSNTYGAKHNLSARLNSDVSQLSRSSERGNETLNTLRVIPAMSGYYESKHVSATFSGEVNYVNRDTGEFNRDDTFEEYRYTSAWQIIPNRLRLSASGALNYQNTDIANFAIADFLNNADNLSKTRSNRLLGEISLPNGDYVRSQGSASYSITESESNPQNAQASFDNENYTLQGRLVNGDRAKRLVWSVSGQYQVTSRNNQNQQDFISRNVNGVLDTYLLPNLGLRLDARHEANQTTNEDTFRSQIRQFDSIGVGLTYRSRDDRYISITWNQGDNSNDEPDDDKQTFVGVDLNWALSPRSGIEASLSRRFFGDAAAVGFRYNTKKLRASINYNESVTSFSTLIANPENLGLFVCPEGEAQDIANCFQPSSLNFVPTEGQSLVQFTTFNNVVEDSVFVRKATNGLIGYEFIKLRLALSMTYSLEDYLERTQQNRTISAQLDANYELNKHTSMQLIATWAQIDQVFEANRRQADNINANLIFNRQLGPSLSAYFNAQHIEREGNIAAGQLGENYQERRIGLGLQYIID